MGLSCHVSGSVLIFAHKAYMARLQGNKPEQSNERSDENPRKVVKQSEKW